VFYFSFISHVRASEIKLKQICFISVLFQFYFTCKSRLTLAYAFSLSTCKAFLDNSPHCRIGIKLPGSMYTKQCRGYSVFPLVGTQTVILMYSFFIGERCLHGQLWQIQSGVTSAVLLFQNRIHNHHQYPVPTTMVHHHHHHHH